MYNDQDKFKEDLYQVKDQATKKAVLKKKQEIVSEKLLEDPSIVYYTCDDFFGAINNFLRNLGQATQINPKTSEFNFCFSLMKNLNKLDPYFGITHRGMHKFKLSKHSEEGNIYYFSNFFSSSIKTKVAKKFVR